MDDKRTPDEAVSASQVDAQFCELQDVRGARVWLGKDGIVRAVVNELAEPTLGDAKAVVAAVKLVGGGQRHPLLVDLRKTSKTSGREARQYYASPEAGRYIQTAAMLIESGIAKMMANFFIRFNRPAYPIRMFTDEHEALSWLKGTLPNNGQ